MTQPWASLVIWGAKRNETRSYQTLYRGKLAIHASLGFPRWAIEFCFEMPFSTVLRRNGITQPAGLPRGMVIGTVNLVDCVPVEQVADKLSETEIAFGDYSFGRYAWILEDPVMFDTPISAKGKLGLWNWEGDAVGLQKQ